MLRIYKPPQARKICMFVFPEESMLEQESVAWVARYKESSDWLLYLPSVVACASLLFLFGQIFFRTGRFRGASESNTRAASSLQGNGERLGTNFAYTVARLVGNAILIGLSLARVATHAANDRPTWAPHPLIQSSFLLVYVYSLTLSLTGIFVRGWRGSVERHTTSILISTFLVYGYRDLWPLATFKLQPKDKNAGLLLWTEIGVQFLVAILIPIFTPRSYVPVDPEHPSKDINPEQKASLFSYLVCSYLDPVIAASQKGGHLAANQLPPQSDYDRADYLMSRSLPYLDPLQSKTRRHLFFRLLRIFKCDVISALAVLTADLIFDFLSPLSINRLLTYLQAGRTESTFVRPWVWVACLFLGPMVRSISTQAYSLIVSRTLVRIESILSQIIFEHSLRLRIKMETPSSTDGSPTKAGNFVGRLNNLLTTDLNNVTNGKGLLNLTYYMPVKILISVVFLYAILGWSAIVGVVSMTLLLPVPGYIAKSLHWVQAESMIRTDSRMQTITETVHVLRMVKLFGWEPLMKRKIDQKRDDELVWVWKEKVFDLLNDVINHFLPTITMIITFATYTLVMKEELTAAKVFSTMSVFDSVREQLSLVTWELAQVIKGKVSLDRIDEFLRNADLLDIYRHTGMEHSTAIPLNAHEIGFKNATFTWNLETDTESTTPSSTPFKLAVPGELFFKKEKINLILGPTGSGKTSMLMALLGEMHYIPSGPDSLLSLPSGGGVAYAVQESWVQNDTIRNNILFNSPYNESRYNQVLYQCALEVDMKLFDAGDMTEVGERGLTLSGGQRARLTLARAIYSNAETLLLDDVLAALDVHTSKWIVQKCFMGDLVRGRTVILVTHNVGLASPIADFIVSIGADGQVTSREQTPTNPSAFIAESEEDEEADGLAKVVVSTDRRSEPTNEIGKLVVPEETKEGRVGWKALKVFFQALGGDHIALFFVMWISGSLMERFLQTFTLWFLGYWSTQYEVFPPGEVPVARFMGIYVALTMATLLVFSSTFIWFIFGSIDASKSIHGRFIESILGTTLRWLDQTPVSRIITRATQDIATLDTYMMWDTQNLCSLIISMTLDLGSAVFFVPFFTIPGLAVACAGAYLSNIYLTAQLSAKREMSNAKAPMLAHFSASLAGLVSIRAYGAQTAFQQESRRRTDHYVRIARVNSDLGRWSGIRIDFLGALFTTSLATYLTYFSSIEAGNIGFSLNRAVEFCSSILYFIRLFNSFQIKANSIERLVGYTEIEQEPKSTESGRPPAHWPISGELHVENLTVRYSETGPIVLKDLSFSVKSGERVGIVGRTGSGKSSLTLALLRAIPTHGAIILDGLDVHKINLDSLRSNITIIPQVPELLEGTLRLNLDPFEQYDDAELNRALQSSGLLSSHTDSGRQFTLESDISGGGINLSVGQRQIIALARAILRRSKVLILDEATSAIDHETDAIIQRTLRQELTPNTTVLTVAHRLQTILDSDRIMVLDAGRMVEFGPPSELLSNEESLFKALVDESKDS